MEDDDLLFHHEAGFEAWRVRWDLNPGPAAIFDIA